MTQHLRRFGIDVRYLSHGLMGGVHTYVRHFVPELIKVAADCEIVLYADTKRPFELPNLPPHVTVRLLKWRNPLSTIQHDLLLRRYIELDHLDVMHFPANYGIAPSRTATVVTIHDAINLLPIWEIVRGHPKRPGTIAKMTYLHLWTRVSHRHADLILTVSKHAGREIARHSGRHSPEIVPIPHAPTPDLRRVTDEDRLQELRERYRLGRGVVLADALKNPSVLARAWKLLPAGLRRTHQIVFFSRRPDVSTAVLEAVERGDARLIVQPSREDLIGLYSIASAFAFPSWIEGFGLPVLEAMTCGAPVIASDRGSLPEVAGDAALLADAEDAAGFAMHIERVLSDPTEHERLRRRGFAWAAQFTWANTARQIFDGYVHAYARHAASLATAAAPNDPRTINLSGTA